MAEGKIWISRDEMRMIMSRGPEEQQKLRMVMLVV